MAKREFKNGKTSQAFYGFCGHGDNLVLCADAGICGGVNYFDEAEW